MDKKVSKQNFYKGIQSDLDKSITERDTYIDANDVSLSGNNKFLTLENIGGTDKVGQLIASFVGESTVLATVASKYVIDDIPNIDCLTVFTGIPSGNFTIYCFRLDTQAVIPLFTESFVTGNVVDYAVYPENNVDIIYFTDNNSEVRNLRCDISTPYTITAEQLSLQRRGTMASLELSGVDPATGTLLSGSYQFCIRFYNSDIKVYTKWTIPSAPVLVTSGQNDSITSGTAGYNTVTDKSIDIDVTSYPSIITPYTHYQFAVIENIGPVSPIVASLQPLEDLVSDTFTFNYANNTKIADVALADIVVDFAAVQNAQTLAIKNNRLFVGNINYWNRDYDRTPTVTGTIDPNVVTNNKDDFQTSLYKGYFRDEVYRFYISYFDEYYNFSRPKKLDMTAITDNQMTGDMKFPRGRGGAYHVMNTGFQYLNLDLTIDNHPPWSRGFVILRAKRKKKVLFQTPVVPMSEIQGIDVIGSYPNTADVDDGTGTNIDKSLPDVTPMNSAGTWMPKNFFFSENRNIKKLTVDQGSGKKGEAYYELTSDSPLHCIFPPSTIYHTDSVETKEYEFKTGHLLDSVDIAFLKATQNDATQSSYSAGDTSATSVHSTFYAEEGDYRFCFGGTEGSTPMPASTDIESKINAYKVLDNYGEGTTLNGKYIGNFGNLDTNGLNWFQKPNNQRIGVIETKDRQDASTFNASISTNLGGAPNNTVPAGFFSTTVGGPFLVPDRLINPAPNAYVYSKGGFTPESTYVSMVDVANVINSYGDDRYGDDNELHDMVFTGAIKIFDPSDLATIVSTGVLPISVDVAGGDCFVSRHAFKITDNCYSIMNATKVNSSPAVLEGHATLLPKWTYFFQYGTPAICMPVGLKNVSQVIQVVLEGEYNGETTGVCPYPTESNIVDSDTESSWRVSFAYPFHVGLLKESDQKAFTPFDENEQITTSFPSRILWSDQKVYNTDITGFDLFRVSNILDLEDTYRGITKLALTGDSLFAIQAQAVAYVPVDAQLIETADVNTLSIRSGKVVDIPVYISRLFGTQHLKSVIYKDNFIIFTDNINKAVLRLSGQEIENLTDLGVSTAFRDLLATSVASNNIYGLYDNRNRQYLVFSNIGNFCYVWDDRLKCWIGTQSYNTQNRLYDGVYFDNYLYLLGRNDSNNLNVYKAYEGTPGQLFGNIITPSVTFTVNDEFDVAKTFDNFIIYSSDKLDTADIISEQEPGVTNQEVVGQDIEIARREGAYRVAVLRDDDNARIRGTRANVTLNWKTLASHDEDDPADVDKVSLSGVITKYRFSARYI